MWFPGGKPYILKASARNNQTDINDSRANGNIRRNLSVAPCMDYTSPVTARLSEPRQGRVEEQSLK